MQGRHGPWKPLAHGPWLRYQVWTPTRALVLGSMGVGYGVGLRYGVPWDTALGRGAGLFDLLMVCLSTLLPFVVCGFFLGWLYLAAGHQYCPDCLQRMERGARVCPWCHFRPAPSGANSPTGHD